MRQNAARIPLCAVLVAVVALLSTGIAYAADAGAYAGTYVGSYTKPYDVGTYEQTVVLNGDGTGTNSVTYLGESATCAIRYLVDGSDIVVTAVPTNVSASGKIDGSGIWLNGHLLEKVVGAAPVSDSTPASQGAAESRDSGSVLATAPQSDSHSAFSPDADGAVKPGDEWEPGDRPASSETANRPSADLSGLRSLIENCKRTYGSDSHSGSVSGSAGSSSTRSSSSSYVEGGSATRAMRYDEGGYCVTLPAYWEDRVTANEPDASDATFEVRSKEYPARVLCTISVVSSRDRVNGGDIGNPLVKQVSLADGRVVCVRAANYSWIVASGSGTMAEAEAAELVDLSTGGKTVASCVQAAQDGNNMVSAHWVANNVVVEAR